MVNLFLSSGGSNQSYWYDDINQSKSEVGPNLKMFTFSLKVFIAWLEM